MTRQKVRKSLIIVSFLLFPITIFYFSPYLIVWGAAEGIIVGSFIVFFSLFIFSLLFGRLFCGWVCPAGGLQEIYLSVKDKKAKTGKYDWIKYFIWAPWIGSIIVLLIITGIKTVEFFFQIDYGISISNPQSYIVYYFFVGLIVLLAHFAGKRAFCHYVCWMAPFMIIGNKIKSIFKWPSLHLAADSDKCIQCKLCSKVCSMSLEVNEMVQKQSMYHSECILCGECIDTCKQRVLKYSFGSQKN